MTRAIVQSNNQQVKNSHPDSGNISHVMAENESKIAPISSIVFEDSDKNSCSAAIINSNDDCSDANQPSEANEHTDGPRYTFSTEIPEAYDDPYLCILPRTPDNYYVYWEDIERKIGENQHSDKQKGSAEQWLLRIKELSGNDAQSGRYSYFDLPVDIDADNNSYINFPRPLSPVSFELGKISSLGQFEPVVSMDDNQTSKMQNSDFNSPLQLHQWYEKGETENTDTDFIRISKNTAGFTDKTSLGKVSPDSRYFGSASPG